MPRQNRFRHQSYVAWGQPPIPTKVATVTREQVAEIDVGTTLRRLRIRTVIFVHGTFVGDDPFGLAQRLDELSESVPAMLRPALKVIAMEAWGHVLRGINQRISDKVFGEVGSFQDEYLNEFRRLLGGDAPSVERFDWSSGNNHLSRAEAAVELFNRLTDLPPDAIRDRVLLWGHSHAGNVFALLTNLLANDRAAVLKFFEAGGSIAERSAAWQTARQRLAAAPTPHPLAKGLNIVTFGTPVRYGWDRDGYARLLHVCNHRPVNGQREFLAKPAMPQTLDEIVQAKFGDWVQSMGIAGTDLIPMVQDERAADRALRELLETDLGLPEVDTENSVIDHLLPMVRDKVRAKLNELQVLLNRWRSGPRVPSDGDAAWLFDYGTDEIALFGHGVYMKRTWLPFHATRVTEWLRQTWEP